MLLSSGMNLLTTREAAAMLRCSPRTLRRRIATGHRLAAAARQTVPGAPWLWDADHLTQILTTTTGDAA